MLLTVDGHEQEFTASDPYSTVQRLNQQDCLEQAVQEVAALDLLSELAIPPDQGTAVVRLSLVPTGSTGTFTITGFGTTTLLADDPGHPWPRNITVTGTGAPTWTRRSRRCDLRYP
ncbi:hypothetical protein QMA10_11580 [Arthrobacter sp. APC 3897]|uniref:hypothetical protein n=1 Tax=Arthrobacter sp. APC 3897 TaxID=3035204 RepID=UPI0025B447CA|nr:hypothetical protein [Arthrobacter sp. APC 3897]MDN3482561.1 hypothetical protein [Arthrobacter sp. APC 3897]